MGAPAAPPRPAAAGGAAPAAAAAAGGAGGAPLGAASASASTSKVGSPAVSPGSGDPRFAKCGFAKLLGEGLEYFIQKYEVVLGRRSKAVIDVVLGDAAVLSRQHARILYNFEAKKWQLVVEGKNGVIVNGVLQTPASGPCNLASQDLLQAGDMSFYFLLPKLPRKPKAKLAASAGAAPHPPQQQHQPAGAPPSQAQPGTPVLGSPAPPGAGAAAAGVRQPSPQFPGGGSPALPGSAAGGPALPSAAGAAAAAAGTAADLTQYPSGPLLAGAAPMQQLLPPSGLGFPSLGPGVGLPGSATSYGNGSDLLQPSYGLGLDEEDEGMMDADAADGQFS